MTTLTALTAQNTTGVRAIHLVPPAFVEQALRAVLDDMPVHAVKTGMLGSAQTVEAVASLVREMGLQAVIVVDPVPLPLPSPLSPPPQLSPPPPLLP